MLVIKSSVVDKAIPIFLVLVPAEFCIPPCSTAKEFITSIQYALSDIQARADKLGLSLATLTASALFDRDQLRTRAAQQFGCDPDYNVYTRKANPRPKATDKTLRSAGGHVHVGTDKDPFSMGKTLDLLLGVPSVLLDKDEQRRLLYGKAGAIRFKPYGLEYRTLSNFWIWDEKTIEWVYHQVQDAIEFCDEYNCEFAESNSKSIIQCINNNDKELAKQLINRFEIHTP